MNQGFGEPRSHNQIHQKMNKHLLLTALSVVGLTLGTQTRALAVPPKTNSVMTLNFALTAWPNAVAIRDQLSSRSAGAMFMPIIGQPNDYFPGFIPGEGEDQAPINLVDVLPVDGSFGDIAVDDGDVTFALATQIAPRNTAQVVAPTGVFFSVASRDLINSLNGVTNNGTVLHFTNSTARLMFKQVLSPRTLTVNTFGTNRQAIVREKVSGRNVDTDVSRFFSAGDNYVSTSTVNGEARMHQLSALSFNNTRGFAMQLSALLTEATGLPQTNGVIQLRSLNWDAHGSGHLTGSTSNLVLGGGVTTGNPNLE